MIKKIIDWLQTNVSKGKENKKARYMIVIALIGILFILISNLFQSKDKIERNPVIISETNDTEEEIAEVSLIKNVDDIEASYEKDLQAMLNQIDGVSEVEVMINVDSTNVNVYEKDLIVGVQTTDESDKNGGIRKVEDNMKETSLVYVRQGDQEVPLLIQTKKPEVRGVFIVAKGAENANIQKWIIDAVSRVLDVPTYRISVMPK